MKTKSLPDFSGKVVLAYFVGDSTAILHSPSFQVQGGRLFLVGVVPKGGSPKDWAAGVTVAVAWDSVQDYFVFPSADAYRRASRAFTKRQI
jgi:hypothetical protein